MKQFNRGVNKNNKKAIDNGLIGNLMIEEFEVIAKLFEKDGELICPYCNKPGADTLDHLIPLSELKKKPIYYNKKGIGTTKNNIVPAHADCNSHKSSKEVHCFEEECNCIKINKLKIEMVIKNNYNENTTYLKFTDKDWEMI